MSTSTKVLIALILTAIGLFGLIITGAFADTNNNIIYQNTPADAWYPFHANPSTTIERRDVALRWQAPSTGMEVCSIKFQIFSDDIVNYPDYLMVHVNSTSFENDRPDDFAEGTDWIVTTTYYQVPVSSSYDFSQGGFSEAVLPTCFNTVQDKYYWFRIDAEYSGDTNHEWEIGANSEPSSRSLAFSERNAVNQQFQTPAGWFLESNFTWSFQIHASGSGGATPLPNPLLAPNPHDYGFTDQDFGLFGNLFRDVIRWLFIPKEETVNLFSGLFDGLSLKPPFGYFTAIHDEFSDLASGSATVSFGTLTAVSSILDPIRTGFGWLLWLLFGVFLIKRFTSWDWHL